VKRNDDLMRDLLLEFERQEDWSLVLPPTMSLEDRERIGHVNLLCDAGLVTRYSKDSYRITNEGHDFLDAIRDEGLWQKTKDTVSETGGNATLEIVKALAIGFLKKKIAQQTDIDLG